MLKKLNEWVLYVNKKKSQFETQKVSFLRYIIWLSKIIQNLQKTKTVIDWFKLTKLKKVQIFLDLMNYYWQYIVWHLHTMKLLMHLTHKNENFHWNEEQKKIFVNFKIILTETTQLCIFWSECNKKIKVNVLDFAISDSLYQIEDNQQKLIVFWLWKLTESEKHYKVYDKKLLIIVKLFKKWRVYLKSTTKLVMIYTDHKNLWNFATIK